MTQSAATTTTSAEVNTELQQAHQHRIMQDEQHCQQASSLATTFVSDTQAYGVMFGVRAKQEPLIVETLELSSVFLTEREIHVEVYTKEGGYKTFEADPKAWIKIVDTRLSPADEGHGTLIPKRDFHPVEILPYTERAFYVTLDTTDLRYANTPGYIAGDIYAQDEHVEIHVGAGLLEYPFSNRPFEPRVFCGIVHFKMLVDCDSMPIVSSKVSYAFILQHDGLDPNLVTSQVNSIVRGSIVSLLGSDLELTGYKESASLALDSVQSIVSAAYSSEAYAECVSNTIRTCTAVATELTFAHTANLSKGHLIYLILRYRSQVTANLNIGNSMDAVYVGFIPVETELLVRLKGVPIGTNMNDKQTAYYEETAQAFLVEKLERVSSVTILSVHVKNEKNEQNKFERRLVGAHRRLPTDQKKDPPDDVEIATIVTASFRPPPFVDFAAKIEDLIDLDGKDFLDDLVGRRDLNLDPDDASYFAKIKKLSARPVDGIDRNNAKKTANGRADMPGWGIFLLIVFFLLLSVILGCLYWNRRGRAKFEKEDDPKIERKGDVVEEYVSQVYENAFRGLIDEQEAEIILSKESQHKSQRQGLLKSASFKSGKSVHLEGPHRQMPPPPSASSRRVMGNTDHQSMSNRRPYLDNSEENRAYHAHSSPVISRPHWAEKQSPASQRGLMDEAHGHSRRHVVPTNLEEKIESTGATQKNSPASRNTFDNRAVVPKTNIRPAHDDSIQTRRLATSDYSRSRPTARSFTTIPEPPPSQSPSTAQRREVSATVGLGGSAANLQSRSTRSAFDQTPEYSRSAPATNVISGNAASVSAAASSAYSKKGSMGSTRDQGAENRKSHKVQTDRGEDISKVGVGTSKPVYSKSRSVPSALEKAPEPPPTRQLRRVSFQDGDDVASVDMGADSVLSRKGAPRRTSGSSPGTRSSRSGALRDATDGSSSVAFRKPSKAQSRSTDDTLSKSDASRIDSPRKSTAISISRVPSGDTSKPTSAELDELTAASEHTTKRDNKSSRGMGGQGASQQDVLNTYMKNPEELL